MQIKGIIYEISTLQEVFQVPSYLPQGSKAYYYCKQSNKIYELGFNGQYVETKDFDNIFNNKTIENEPKSAESTKTEPKINIDEDVKSSIEYLSKHVYNINFKVDEVIKMFNPLTLPSDILTRYNPDTQQKIENKQEGNNAK